MPISTETPATGYLHCRNAMCAGYHQQEAPVSKVETSWTFGEMGGDGVFTHMVQNSSVVYVADAKELPCPVCGENREVSGQPRPSYQPLSGHDPMGLLNVPRFDPNGTAPESDEEIEARIRARLKEEQIEARLRAEMD